MRTPKRPHANAVEQPGGARSASNGAQRYDQRSQCQRCLLTIVGGVREAWSIWRRGRLGTVCARGAHAAWSCGPSTSPLGGSSQWQSSLLRTRTVSAFVPSYPVQRSLHLAIQGGK